MTANAPPPPGTGKALRDLLSSLAMLQAAASANLVRAEEIKARIARLERELAEGRPLPEVVLTEERPVLVELITMNIEALQRTGRELRRAEAQALRAYGWSLTDIAQLFGVSRQRISELLSR